MTNVEGLSFKQILVVDDEPLLNEALVESLEAHEIGAISAANGVEALAALKTHPEILIVITDIRMPNMTGTELLRQAQIDWPERTLRWFGLTGLPDPNALEVGDFDQVFCKPFPLSLLVRVIKTQLKREAA